MNIESITNTILGMIWSPYLVLLCLLTGLYFSIRTRFIQLRGLPDMLKLMFRHERSDAGISSFQALSMSLSGRIGVGNIAGVAMAIAFGGPGAIFWMWVVAFLGASSAFIESTLAQIYKERDGNGQYRGGPAFYIEKGLGQRWYAVVFALVTVLAGTMVAGTQSNAITSTVNEAWNVSATTTAVVLLVILGLILIGGVRRIARVTEWIVPLMAATYLLVTAVVMIINVNRVPEVIMLVLRSAFGAEAAFGAMIGTAIQWGVRRGVFSNEAGMGSGAHHAAAAEVSHPVKQGLVQAFSVYIDTLVVCSSTAFLILSTGLYNVYDPAANGVPSEAHLLLSNLPGVEAGPRFVQHAVESALPGLGRSFIAIAILLFALTTILALYYMAETNISYLFRNTPPAWAISGFQLLFLAATGYSAINSATFAWSLGDIGVGMMSWLNIIAMLLLQKPALAALRDYEAQQKVLRDPLFNPRRAGVLNTEAWESR